MLIDGYCTLGVDREYDLTESALLHAMDAAGVDKAMIASPDRYLAVYNREGNEIVRSAVAAHKDRFIGTCSASPWFGEAAITEIRQAVEAGARMMVLHPWIQGYQANDELVFPMLDEASQQQIPVYVHTGPPGNSTPWQVVDLAERYPSLDFIMGHCGATDFWNDVINAASQCENIYLESSLARPFHFAHYMEKLGKHKGIMGSWAPINNLAFEWEQMRKFTSADIFDEISGNNLARLLNKKGGAVIVDCHTHWGIHWEEQHPGNPSQWLAVLDRHQVDKSFVFGHANLTRSDMCSEDNDNLVRIAAKYPERLIPVGTAWPQLVEKGIAEAKRCIDIGVGAFKFHPWIQGFSTADPVFDEMVELAGEANLPIFFHDGTPCYSLSEQIAGVARRHPRTKIVLGHSGLLWNWRSALVAARIPNLWLCLCGPHIRAIELLCKNGPTERIVWGSDFGFGAADQIEYRLNLLKRARINADLLERILGANALALLA